jgi:hypothetical protein
VFRVRLGHAPSSHLAQGFGKGPLRSNVVIGVKPTQHFFRIESPIFFGSGPTSSDPRPAHRRGVYNFFPIKHLVDNLDVACGESRLSSPLSPLRSQNDAPTSIRSNGGVERESTSLLSSVPTFRSSLTRVMFSSRRRRMIATASNFFSSTSSIRTARRSRSSARLSSLSRHAPRVVANKKVKAPTRRGRLISSSPSRDLDSDFAESCPLTALRAAAPTLASILNRNGDERRARFVRTLFDPLNDSLVRRVVLCDVSSRHTLNLFSRLRVMTSMTTLT